MKNIDNYSEAALKSKKKDELLALIKDYKANQNDLVRCIAENQQTINGLNTNLNEYAEEITKLNDTLRRKDVSLKEANAISDGYRKELEETKSRLANMEKDISGQVKAYNELDAHHTNLQNNYVALDEEYNESQRALRTTRNYLIAATLISVLCIACIAIRVII